jgi:DNA-binding transcriptional ArsR family regulator
MAPPSGPDVATIAGIIGQPTRAAMLDALLGGRWLTATELAKRAGVAPPTASSHLAALVESGLVTRRRSGRHRYHALAGPEVGAALESLGRLTATPRIHDGVGSPEERALRYARTCYDHLAGKLGVLIADTLVEHGMVSPDGSQVTAAGESCLCDLGIDVATLKRGRRSYVRFCLDWSERRDHLAGAVGAAIAEAMLERHWVVRVEGTRAVRLTVRGRDGLDRVLGIPMEETDPESR